MKKLVAFAFLCVLSTPVLAVDEPSRVVFFGDSLTAGHDLDPSLAYPALLQKKSDALGWKVKMVNAGLSGDTTAAALRRLPWTLKQKTDVLVIALGTNDGLRGLRPEITRSNLQKIIEDARKKSATMTIILCGLQIPPNYGRDYSGRFAALFPDLARKNNLLYVPFLLEGVGGVPSMNLADRVHPNKSGHVRIADNVWKILKPELARRLAREK